MAVKTTGKKQIRSKTSARPARKKSSDAPDSPATSDAAQPKGIFITLEGGEGSGKSTQMRLLAEKLESLGHQVVTTREPGGSPGAEAVRHVLLSGAAEPFGAELEAMLFAASRADHVDQVIRPALEAGKIVISDRFFDSTRVYQGTAEGMDNTLLQRLERVACGDTWPDLTLILDIDPHEGMKRAAERRNESEAPDRFEKESIRLQAKRRQAYLDIANAEPERCAVVDASGRPQTVFSRLWQETEKRLADRLKTGNKTTRTAQRKPAAKKPASAGKNLPAKPTAKRTGK